MQKDYSPLRPFLESFFGPDDLTFFGVIAENRARLKSVTVEGLMAALPGTDSADNHGPLCFTVNPAAPGKKRTNEDMAALNAFVVDIDGGGFPSPLCDVIPPSWITRRGATNWHLYYIVDRQDNTPENRGAWRAVYTRLIEAAGGDPAVKDPARLIRLPLTYHEKTGDPAGYQIAGGDGRRYPLTAIIDGLSKAGYPVTFPDAADSGAQRPAEKPKKSSKKKRAPESAASAGEIEEFLLSSRPVGLRAGEGRSRTLFYFGLDCHAWGIPADRALELGETFNRRACDPPESASVVKHQIRSAYRYSRAEFGHLREALASASDEKAVKIFQAFRRDQHVRETLKNWVYVLESDRMVSLTTNADYYTRYSMDMYITSRTGGKEGIQEAVRKKLIRVVDRMDFRPDRKKRIYREHGLTYLNRFAGLALDANSAGSADTAPTTDNEAVAKFLRHLQYLTNTEEELDHLLEWLTYAVQNPGKKIAHAVLLISQNEGIGKSILEDLFSRMLRGVRGDHYVTSVENKQIVGDYNDFMQDSLLCFVHETAQGDRYAAMNSLKSLITEPRVPINQKYARTYHITNTVNFIFFSNYMDAMKIKKQTRRLFVVYNDKHPMPQEYYDDLKSVLNAGYADIYRFLKTRPCTLHPFARPPETEGRQQLLEHSESELSIYLSDLCENEEGPFARGVLTLQDLLQYAGTYGPPIVQRMASFKTLSTWLAEGGWNYKDVDWSYPGPGGTKIRLKKRVYKRSGGPVTKEECAALVGGVVSAGSPGDPGF